MFETTERPHVIRDARGKRPQFYEEAGLDTAMSMILVLASELSTLRDRLDSAERVAKLNGMDLAAGIEALELDQAALEEREARRQDFLARLYYLARKDAQEASEAETAEGFKATIEEIAQG
ncbi:hypothetical protein EOE18_03230 [Novosphingobium umbonatum]|jgi:uncharacterized protein (DUF2267 family)|uniref:Uncharacterized protein n=1 Tax=Novosphingobium umbonatum TaxID=1908524 RepID=A0A3S2UV31_9SPHN|nr:hypothetical protein [Novosphingobium umbonatum]RVU06986.1 hypothetical protein EOE18_03230 [Novosphingobium umbonatum]